MVMEVAHSDSHSDNMNKTNIKSNLKLEFFPSTTSDVFDEKETPPSSHSSNFEPDNEGIPPNSNTFAYDELTPSSSPSTPEFCDGDENNTIIDIKSEFTEIYQVPPQPNNVCSEYMGDISDIEAKERPEDDKLYQRYKRTKYYQRNIKSSYLYRKTNIESYSSSEEGETTSSNFTNKFNARKIQRRLKRQRKNKRLNVLNNQENSASMTPVNFNKTIKYENANHINANDIATEVIESSLSETKLSTCQPFVNSSVLTRKYQNANQPEIKTPKENRIDIVKDMNMSIQQREFHEILERGDSLELISLLQKNGSAVNINLVDKEGQTALHKTIMNGNFELVKILVNFGANTKLANRDGWTALHMAAHSGHSNIMFYLISNIR